MRSALAAAVVLLGLSAPDARADEIVFINGDRLTGKLVSLIAEKIQFKSDVAGSVEVPADRVKSLSTKEPVELHTKGGEILDEVLGPYDVDGAMWLAKSGRSVRVTDTRAINPPEKRVWSGDVKIGWEINRGNTHDSEFDGEFNLQRRSGLHRTRFKTEYDTDRVKDLETGDSSTPEKRFFGELNHNYFIGEKPFVFGLVSFEKNEPADLDRLSKVGGGLGYQLRDEDRDEFMVEGGVVYVDKTFTDDSPDEDYFAALFRWRFKQYLTKRLSVFSEGDWTPSLEDSKDQLIETNNGIRSDLTETFFLEAKVEWDWDTSPADNAKRQDVEYVLSLGYKF